jgi:D-alanyl-D-alanine carboxypeptidase (penicillin-binding protein 5/6)
VSDESDSSVDTVAPVEQSGSTGEGTAFTTTEISRNGNAVAPGSMTGGTVAAILEVAPPPDPLSASPTEVEPPLAAPALPPVSRTAPVLLSPPMPLAPPLPGPTETTGHVAAHLPAPLVAAPNRHRRRWPWVVVVVLVVVAVVAGLQLSRPFPAVSLQQSLPSTPPVAGAPPALPWPATGEAAVAVPQLGVTVQSGPEAAVPIASLTKIMTAYVTLRDHPLAPNAQGPMLTMTAADQADASADEGAGATNVAVQPGEVLSERQLLNGLLVHSANNLADVLAKWDAGSLPAFVAKMNATAAALGMAHTHYADVSGLDPGTTGTAGDELLVTQAAMDIPTFAAAVAQPSVTLPIAGVLYNYVSSVGTDGVVGVKSGFTQLAMGCLVLAGERTVGGHPVLVLAAVTGQPGANPLNTANAADEHLLDAVASGLREVPVAAAGVRVGSVNLPWAQKRVPVVATQPMSLLAWPGQEPRLTFSRGPLRAGMPARTRVGTLSASIGHERVTVPVQVTTSLVGPSPSWRLKRPA